MLNKTRQTEELTGGKIDSEKMDVQAWKQVEEGVYTLRYETPADDPVEWGRDVSYLDNDFKEWQEERTAEVSLENR